MKEVRLHIDGRSRVCLSAFLPKDIPVSSLRAYEEDGRIILEPMAEVPARELWLHQNDKALKSLQKGIQDANEGKLCDLGSFAEYADDELES